MTTQQQSLNFSKKLDLIDKTWKLVLGVVTLLVAGAGWAFKIQFDVANLTIQVKEIKQDRDDSIKAWTTWREKMVEKTTESSTKIEDMNRKIDLLLQQKGK